MRSRYTPLVLALLLAAGCRRADYLPGVAAPPDAALEADAGAEASPDSYDSGVDLAPDAMPDFAPEPDTAVDLAPDGPPATLNPGDLAAHLALWLDGRDIGATGLDSRVTGWKDRSSNFHVARPDGPGPWFLANALPGRNAVRFALEGGKTSRLLVADHPSLRWGTGDFLIGIVARYRNTTLRADIPHDYGLLVAKVDTAGPPYPGPGLWGNNPWPATESTQILFQTMGVPEQVLGSRGTGYNDDHVHLMIGIRESTQLRLRVDGMETRSLITTVPDVSATGYPLAIGAHPDGPDQQLDGDVFEVFAFSSSLPIDQLQALERYASDKYGIALH